MSRPKPSLRVVLAVKARAGRFDARMCSYYGVSPNVNDGCRKAICRAYAAGLVPTSTLRSGSSGSYHNRRDAKRRGLAVDFGLRRELVGTSKGRARMVTFQRKEHWRRRKGKIRPVELIGPDNRLIVLRDRETDLSEGAALEEQHDNHVHEAYLR